MKAGAVLFLVATLLIPPDLAWAKPHGRDQGARERGGGEFYERRGGGGPSRLARERDRDRRDRDRGGWGDRDDRDRPGRGGDRRYDDDPPFGDRPRGQMRGGHDQAREAVDRGRHVPLGGVVSQIRRRSPGGRLLDAGLESDRRGRPVYRVRWSTGDGRRVDYIVDAQTGVVIGEDD